MPEFSGEIIIFPFIVLFGCFFIFNSVTRDDFAGYMFFSGAGAVMLAAGGVLAGIVTGGAAAIVLCVLAAGIMTVFITGAGSADVHDIRYRPQNLENHIIAVVGVFAASAVQAVFVFMIINGAAGKEPAVKLTAAAAGMFYGINILNGIFIVISGLKRIDVSLKRGVKKRDAFTACLTVVFIAVIILRGWFI